MYYTNLLVLYLFFFFEAIQMLCGSLSVLPYFLAPGIFYRLTAGPLVIVELNEVIFTGVVSKSPGEIPKTGKASPAKIVSIQQQ